jgi:hypothetical protein
MTVGLGLLLAQSASRVATGIGPRAGEGKTGRWAGAGF